MYSTIGSFGALLILIAFILNQFHIWKDHYFIYDLINFLGGVLLVIYAILLDSFPFAVLNGIWSLVSFRDCIRDLQLNAKKNEKNFYKKWFH